MGSVFNAALQLLQMPLTFFGHTFSLWAVLLFGMIGSLLLSFIFRLFE